MMRRMGDNIISAKRLTMASNPRLNTLPQPVMVFWLIAMTGTLPINSSNSIGLFISFVSFGTNLNSMKCRCA